MPITAQAGPPCQKLTTMRNTSDASSVPASARHGVPRGAELRVQAREVTIQEAFPGQRERDPARGVQRGAEAGQRGSRPCLRLPWRAASRSHATACSSPRSAPSITSSATSSRSAPAAISATAASRCSRRRAGSSEVVASTLSPPHAEPPDRGRSHGELGLPPHQPPRRGHPQSLPTPQASPHASATVQPTSSQNSRPWSGQRDNGGRCDRLTRGGRLGSFAAPRGQHRGQPNRLGRAALASVRSVTRLLAISPGRYRSLGPACEDPKRMPRKRGIFR